MVASCVSASSQPSIIDCCDHAFRMNGSNEDERIHLILRSFEKKLEHSLHEMKATYDVKCEKYDKTIAEISKQLYETQKIVIERDATFRMGKHGMVMDQNVSLSSSTVAEDEDLPHTLHFDKGRMRGNAISDSDSNTAEGLCSVVVHPSDRSHDQLSSNDTTATPASIEQLIRKELRSYMKEVLAERETQTYLLQREIEKQNQQIAQLRMEVLSRFQALDINTKPKGLDYPIPLHCMKFGGAEIEIELIEESIVAHPISKSQPKTENKLALVHTDDPLMQFIRQICSELFLEEAEHLMKIWGSQFDDLTVYLHDNLDKQRECIADVQKSTFEHVDAETQTRAVVLNAQLHSIGRKNQQQEIAMQELRDEHERSLQVIVESFLKLKSKFQGIVDQIKQQEVLHLSSEKDIVTLRQMNIDESNSWNAKLKQQDGKIQLLRDNLDHAVKDIEDIIEDRDSIQTILSATIELFNTKMETSHDLISEQLTTLEKQLHNRIESSQKEIQNLHNHKREMEMVIAATYKKIVDLTTDTGEKESTEVKKIQRKSLVEESAGKNTSGCDDYFKYITVNKKKYKRALWLARKQRSQLFEQDTSLKEIEYYDLTFAESKESD